jgi:hypothetical protein
LAFPTIDYKKTTEALNNLIGGGSVDNLYSVAALSAFWQMPHADVIIVLQKNLIFTFRVNRATEEVDLVRCR